MSDKALLTTAQLASDANSVSGAALATSLSANIARAVVGKPNAIELLLVALMCEGHVLIEDVPGVGKTLLAKALASQGCSTLSTEAPLK